MPATGGTWGCWGHPGQCRSRERLLKGAEGEPWSLGHWGKGRGGGAGVDLGVQDWTGGRHLWGWGEF